MAIPKEKLLEAAAVKEEISNKIKAEFTDHAGKDFETMANELAERYDLDISQVYFTYSELMLKGM